jgi:hypothetical protein
MHLLCKHGDDWHEWYALSACQDAAPLQAEANRRNAEEYKREHLAWLARGKTGALPLPLDDPQRNGYLTYFVQHVADWPEITGN